ncbi:MAG: phosphatase PAP2 family protein [Clostridium sp.]|nr:phosphatase PAP2 family protein [Clostridium sp.]
MHRLILAAIALILSAPAFAQSQTDSISQAEDVRPAFKIKWDRLATNVGINAGLRLAAVQLLKHNVRELRPDGKDYKSFPSQHATWAYGIAGTVTYWLGDRSPWWAIGGQAAANIVGFQRVMSRRHYPGDVFAGAGIGIATDAISELITGAIFGGGHAFDGWRRAENDFSPFLSVSTGASFPLSSQFGDMKIGTSMVSTVRAAFLSNGWAGVSVSASLISTPVKANGQRVCMRPLNSIRIGLGPRAHWQLGTGPFAIGAGAEGGYSTNLKAKGYDADSGSVYISVDSNASVMLTHKLAIGMEGGLTALKLRIGDVSRKIASPQVSIFTKAKF